MKKVPVSLLCGIASIIVTVLLFFIITDDVTLNAMHYLTLAGMIVAEAITTGFAYISKSNPRKVAAAIVSAVAVPVSVLLTIIYTTNYPEKYGAYICWYFVFVIVVNIIAAILYNFEGKKTVENENLQNAKQNMLYMRNIVKTIIADPAAEQHKKALESLEELLHFSNDAVITSFDADIRSDLMEIKNKVETPDYDVAKAIADVSKKINDRNIMCGKTTR